LTQNLVVVYLIYTLSENAPNPIIPFGRGYPSLENDFMGFAAILQVGLTWAAERVGEKFGPLSSPSGRWDLLFASEPSWTYGKLGLFAL